MNKTQLVEEIALRSGLPKANVKKSVDTFIEVASDALRGGEKIVLSGFGSFEVKRAPSRTGRNFLTGTPVDIPPRSVVKFKCSGIVD